MRAPISTSLATVVTLAALAACGSVTAPSAGGSDPGASRPASAARPDAARPDAARPPSSVSGPPAGSRAEAAALARLMLSRLILPSGARRLPPKPVPPALTAAAYGPAAVTPSLDQYRLFALAQPMAAAAAFLAAHVPAGQNEFGTGSGSGPDGVTEQDVSYQPRSVPAGIAGAQVVLTVVPASSGGSLLRADAQITWYPPRSAAEYIGPARYHVLIITVSISGQKPRTVHKTVTSQAFIARLAEALDRSPAEPTATVVCPADFEDYQLSFSVSGSSRPAVTVWANETGCGGAQVTVSGQSQPPLADYGAIGALVRQLVPVTPEL